MALSSALGYRNTDGPNGKRVILPDPESGPLVTQLFDWYATGDVSLTTLTRRATEAGLLTRKSRRPIPRSQIHAMLRSPIYMGEFDWKGTRYVGRHAPLVGRNVWDCVQDILSGRAPRRKAARTRRTFAFSGLVHCGTCATDGLSFLLVGELKKERYVYYRCEECKRRHRAVYVREEAIVRAFMDVWSDAARDPAVRDAITAAAVLADEAGDERSALELAEVLVSFDEAGSTAFRSRLTRTLHSNSVWKDGARHRS